MIVTSSTYWGNLDRRLKPFLTVMEGKTRRTWVSL